MEFKKAAEEKRVYCGNLGCDLCREWFAQRGLDIMQMKRGDRAPNPSPPQHRRKVMGVPELPRYASRSQVALQRWP